MQPLRMTLLLGTLCVALLSGTAHGTAYADGRTAKGANGQTLEVSKATGLSPDGATITVIGRGYDTAKGVYVAFCKDNGPGKMPTPCGGGADTTGKTGGSQWISSNPPPYGKGLAVPYGPGGTFNIEIKIGAKLTDSIDCQQVKCVVATRADHTRTSDRSQDVLVPVAFDDGATAPIPLLVGGGALAALIAAGGVVYLVRRRARTATPTEAPA